MSSAALLVALLAGPGPVDSPAAPPVASAENVRAEYTRLMSRFAGRKRPDPIEIVPPLLDLHARLGTAEGLSHADRRRYVRGVENRLVELHSRMLRDRRSRDGSGGGAAARADELIRLIQATVAPESWDVNGGPGTIRFWSRNPALVIRASGEVHHQVGGTLDALRE